MLRNSIGKAATAVATTAVAGLALLAVPTAAQAATSSCTSSYIGRLCVNVDPHPGYRATLQSTNSLSKDVDWNLICDNGEWYGSKGWFRAEPGRFYSYVFEVGNRGRCKVRLFNIRHDNEFFDTNYVAP